MITPRSTRLLRVRDLHEFRNAIVAAAAGVPGVSRLVVVSHAAAAAQLRRLLRNRGVDQAVTDSLEIVGRDGLYDRLHARLADPPARLSPHEREAIAQAAAREAARALELQSTVHIRPGLVVDMLRFYDQLRRQGQRVARFEELLQAALEREADFDRGAERMLYQTRLLAEIFRAYERRLARSGACDEHTLRERLLETPAPAPLRSIIVTVGDWIADPHGLYVADFDLLARLPGVDTLDLIETEAALASGLHQRIHDWLPGLDEVKCTDVAHPVETRLAAPSDPSDRPWFLSRDREEELIGVARRLKSDERERQRTGSAARELERLAVVYRQPLPYLYVAREVFGGAGIPYQTSDALPLAAEPFAAALDLVFEFASSDFSRETLIALLGSPHFSFESAGQPLTRYVMAELDRRLSDARYLGDLEALRRLEEVWRSAPECGTALPALDAAVRAAEELAPLRSLAPTSIQFERLLSFLKSHDARDPEVERLVEGAFPESARPRRARAAIVDTLHTLLAAARAHDDVPVEVDGLASTVRRWIEAQTFALDSDGIRGVQLLDDHAARYGDFDELTVVGLIEGEWPERPDRNIFYPTSLLSALGWPSEKDGRVASEARFLDLLTSASKRTCLSTVTLDDEALVEPSSLLDEAREAGLSIIAREEVGPEPRIFVEEELSLEPVEIGRLSQGARRWAEVRRMRSNRDSPAFHGQTSALPGQPWSVSAIETYVACPFKFFAQHVLQLEEEPDDEEVMDPRSQGRFVHAVFEDFFKRWQEAGHQAIEPGNLDLARRLFEEVVEFHLRDLSMTEAVLERTRLLGSSAAAGLGEAVLRMEAERPIGVVERRLEHSLRGEFTFQTSSGSRTVSLKGKADRIDLLADGTFRVIDYKLGWPPNRNRALQLPIYSLCAEQRLDGHRGLHWKVSEAVYLAFKGPRRVAPLFQVADRDRILGEAQERLINAVDGISRGEFPPRPDDIFRCDTCAFGSVCRKDYVGDV